MTRARGIGKLGYEVSSTAPSSPRAGDLWYDTTSNVLLVYSGAVLGWVQATNALNDLNPFNDGSQIEAWLFDGNANGVLGNNGTVSGATFTSGKAGQAITFDGVNDYVSFPTGIVPAGSNARSISMWTYLNSSGSGTRQLLYGSGQHNVNNAAFDFEANAYHSGVTTKYGVHWWGNGQEFTGASSVIYDQWVHLVCTHAGGNLGAGTKLYINGSYIGDLSAINQTFSTSSATTHVSGFRAAIGDLPVNGKIDTMRLFNRALTGSEVTTLYTAGR